MKETGKTYNPEYDKGQWRDATAADYDKAIERLEAMIAQSTGEDFEALCLANAVLHGERNMMVLGIEIERRLVRARRTK
jgi:hypothetical protein